MEVIIEYKRIKNIYLKVIKKDTVKITCPYHTSKLYLQKIIEEKADFIKRQMKKIELKDFSKNIQYLGNSYPLRYDDDVSSLLFDGKEFFCKRGLNVEDAFYIFAKNILKQIITSVEDKYLNYIKKYKDIKKPTYVFKKTKSQWGSYNSRKHVISLSLFLIHYKIEVIESVIAHEFAHILELNHGKNFYFHLNSMFDKYKEISSNLKCK